MTRHLTVHYRRRVRAIEKVFLARAASRFAKGAEDAVPDGAKAHVKLLVRVTGVLERGLRGTRKPTSRALSKATLALLIRRMGFQRDQAVWLLVQVLSEAYCLDERAEALLLAAHPEVEEAFKLVDQMVACLPPIQVAGPLTVADVEIRDLRAV